MLVTPVEDTIDIKQHIEAIITDYRIKLMHVKNKINGMTKYQREMEQYEKVIKTLEELL
jgi:hypothetical protein